VSAVVATVVCRLPLVVVPALPCGCAGSPLEVQVEEVAVQRARQLRGCGGCCRVLHLWLGRWWRSSGEMVVRVGAACDAQHLVRGRGCWLGGAAAVEVARLQGWAQGDRGKQRDKSALGSEVVVRVGGCW
jgi:hypothetical protein